MPLASKGALDSAVLSDSNEKILPISVFPFLPLTFKTEVELGPFIYILHVIQLGQLTNTLGQFRFCF